MTDQIRRTDRPTSTTDHRFDAIVVGARCAGSPTAMLLARMGHRVLLVDRAHFPSDTVSTHFIHPPGVAALDRWGLLDRLVATGSPSFTTYSFDFGPVTIAGVPRPAGDTTLAFCPRRTVLDKLLIDAASEAGVEVREGFNVEDLVVENGAVAGIRGHTRGGSPAVERARFVIGADGAHSKVASVVDADQYLAQPMMSVGYYSYWSGLALDGVAWAMRPGRGYGFCPTNDGLTMLLAAWPAAELQTVRRNLEHNYLAALRSILGDCLDGARREERIVGGGVANQLRTPYGPGWVLVGDAGYLKDPVTAQGITDAFHDAERCATALHEVFSGTHSFGEAMADYQRGRDARVLPMYQFTTQIADLAAPPPQLLQLLDAIKRNQEAMNDFASIFAGTLSPADLLDPAHISRLFSTATGPLPPDSRI